MTIDTSAALGTISQVLGEGQFAAVELGVGPMPGPDSPDGGVLVGGAALYIVNQSAPEKQAAAYEFAKCLNEPQQQAEWAAATGYVPIAPVGHDDVAARRDAGPRNRATRSRTTNCSKALRTRPPRVR